MRGHERSLIPVDFHVIMNRLDQTHLGRPGIAFLIIQHRRGVGGRCSILAVLVVRHFPVVAIVRIMEGPAIQQKLVPVPYHGTTFKATTVGGNFRRRGGRWYVGRW